ncbi:MAG: SDR family oxidoreductase [Nitrososphaera sp.]|jgi:nucleoside-diphosphate-sugar epimerase
MEKVLVTGSLGYIGSVLTEYLKKNYYECIGYDTGFFEDCYLYRPSETSTIIRDLRDFESNDLRNVKAVIHLAGIINDPFGNLDAQKIYDPVRDYTFKIANMCKNKGVKFIFASSCSIYGRGQQGLLDENSPPNPQTLYSLNKLQCEEDLKKISDKNFSPISLRLATLFGMSPRIRFDEAVNMLVGMAVTTGKIILNSDGSAWRPHVHILDVCKAFTRCIDLEYNEEHPLILNVGDTRNNYQIIEIANIIKESVANSEIYFLGNDPKLDKTGLVGDKKIQDGVDVRTYKISFEKIKKYINGFQCDWSLQKGILDMINQLKNYNLTESQFSNINFYRLQKLEYLHKNNLITEDMLWTNKS